MLTDPGIVASRNHSSVRMSTKMVFGSPIALSTSISVTGTMPGSGTKGCNQPLFLAQGVIWRVMVTLSPEGKVVTKLLSSPIIRKSSAVADCERAASMSPRDRPTFLSRVIIGSPPYYLYTESVNLTTGWGQCTALCTKVKQSSARPRHCGMVCDATLSSLI